MHKRPLIIKIFGIYLILEPFIRILLLSIEKDFSPLRVFNHAMQLSTVDMFNFWCLFPLSGILLLSYKFVSYILFMLLQVYSLFFHLNYQEFSWPYLSKYPSIAPLILLSINIFITIYLFFPRTREPFFNKKMRWWEKPTRVATNLPIMIFINNKNYKGRFYDLSLTGALISIDDNENLAIDEEINIKFTIDNQTFNLKSQVMRIKDKNKIIDHDLYGIQFHKVNALMRIKLHVALFYLTSRKHIFN